MSKHGFFGGIKRKAHKDHRCCKCKNKIKEGEFYCDTRSKWRTCNKCSYLNIEILVRDKPDFRLFEIMINNIIDYRPSKNTLFKIEQIGPYATRRFRL